MHSRMPGQGGENMRRRVALIIAGGEGERFWPYSTPDLPKQFLSVFTEKSLIRLTFERIAKMIPPEDIYVVTGKRYGALTKEFLPELGEQNIILEPAKRNTFPAIAYSVFLLRRLLGEITIGVFAADHVIKEEDVFLKRCREAYIAAGDKKKIVTFGIIPTRPETNYGYIRSLRSELIGDIRIFSDVMFIEKPPIEKAREYFSSGNFFWNSGMFVFDSDVLISEIETLRPADHTLLKKHVLENDDPEALFGKITSDSIDYAVMEKSRNILMIKGDFSWDDIGNWDALLRMKEKSDPNYVLGEHSVENCTGCVVISEGTRFEIRNGKDLVCVENGGKLLVSALAGLEHLKTAIRKGGNTTIECVNVKMTGNPGSYIMLGLKNLTLETDGKIILINVND